MRFLALGDSLLQENGPDTYPQKGWIQMLPLFLTAPSQNAILDFAKNGRSTKSFQDEGLFAQALEAALPGDVAFISFGHNDEKKEAPLRYTAPFGAYQKNLALMAKTLQEHGVSPIFVTSMSRLHYDEKGTLLRTHGDYPKAMKEVAQSLGLPCLDLEELSYQDLAKRDFEANKRNYMVLPPNAYPNYPEGLDDCSHLSETGAKYVIRLLLPEMKKIPALKGVLI